MDLEQAEYHFQELRAQVEQGDLDESAFRVEVAKLLWQDAQGFFWMLDAEEGGWFCNRGEGWELGDPHSQRIAEAGAGAGAKGGRRLGRWLALGAVLLCLLGMAGLVGVWQVLPEIVDSPSASAPVAEAYVQVTIASPADGDEVPLGQAVAVESTINALPNLQVVERVVLRVDDQTVDAQSIQPQIQLEQISFPLSQLWLPEGAGEFEVVVAALSADNKELASERITLSVIDVPQEVLPEAPCQPDAAFAGDVTIPPDSTFPPGVRLDKVWQVRNSGSCAWGVGYELIRLAGEGLAAPSSVQVPPTPAGELTDLAVTLWAPTDLGSYTDIWQLRSPDGELFGPTLTLTISIQALAQESLPPVTPAELKATLTEDGKAVRLTWSDLSTDEDAFRIYRADMEASIGLAAADSESFLDEGVACGNSYQYSIVAFNVAGASATSSAAAVELPPCGPTDSPPTLSLAIVPTQVQVTRPFTVVFEAVDDLGLAWVVALGEGTGDPVLDSGQIFSCTQVVCTGTWPVSWTREASVTLSLVAVALDSSGQESEPARTFINMLPFEWLTQTATPEP
jgi:hypothetical protein